LISLQLAAHVSSFSLHCQPDATLASLSYARFLRLSLADCPPPFRICHAFSFRMRASRRHCQPADYAAAPIFAVFDLQPRCFQILLSDFQKLLALRHTAQPLDIAPAAMPRGQLCHIG